MKALLIGGTGNISLDITRRLIDLGWKVTLLNRGNHQALVPQAEQIVCDIEDEERAAELLSGREFDVVAQFIAFRAEQVERDIRLFRGKTRQYIFISSASAYQKPLSMPVITESTPLYNPYWQYSRDKIFCEDALMRAYREEGFPFTVVRPSHTYSDTRWIFPLHGSSAWQNAKRILEGKPVLVPGDGTSLWTVTHTEDFAKGFVGLMGNVHAIGESVQITGDEALTWNQIMGLTAQALDREFIPCYVPTAVLSRVERYDWRGSLWGDKANCAVFDNTKLKRLVPGFNATIRFDEGVRRVAQEHLKHPELQVEDQEFDALSDRFVKLMDALGQAAAQL